MSDSNDFSALLERTNELLSVIAKAQLAPGLEAELSDPKMRRLYELTGSEMTAKEIAKKLKASATTISNAWKRWERRGLVVKNGKRYRRVFG
jgi:DNA-binding MarR family transcriptional regulator